MPELDTSKKLNAMKIQIENLLSESCFKNAAEKLENPYISEEKVNISVVNSIPVGDIKNGNSDTSVIRKVTKDNKLIGFFIKSAGLVDAIVVRQSEKPIRVEIGKFKYKLRTIIDAQQEVEFGVIDKLDLVKLLDCIVNCPVKNEGINLMDLLEKYPDYKLIYM